LFFARVSKRWDRLRTAGLPSAPWTLAHELTLAEARERSRFARDLHDDLARCWPSG
jgi:signal transduction histidine kinase